MLTSAKVHEEVDTILNAWRSRAVSILLAVICAFTLLPVIAVVAGRVINVPWSVRGLCIALYLLLLCAAVRPRWSLQRRATVLLVCAAATGTMQLAVARLEGNGRIVLLILPVLAVVFSGPRSGWIWMAIGAGLFALVPLLLGCGLLSGLAPGFIADTPLSYWWLQWLLWLNLALVLMILLSRFERLQRQTMIAERLALRRYQGEVAVREHLEKEVHRVGEAERRRLGAELHDGLCQHLTAILLDCTAAGNHEAAARSPISSALGQIRDSIEEAIGMAHDVACGLCPVDIEPDGLVPALEQLCRAVQSRHPLSCHLRAEAGLMVHNPERAMQLYRIAGEAVANAVKHARCTGIHVALVRDGDVLELQVADDGQPRPAEAPAKAGIGIGIMEYRAGLAGGTIAIHHPEAGGTQVTCRIPDAAPKL